MIDESRDIVGEEEVGGGGEEYSTAIGGRNAATSRDAGATLCAPNNRLYGRLDEGPQTHCIIDGRDGVPYVRQNYGASEG